MNKVYNKELDRHVSVGPNGETVVMSATLSATLQNAAAAPGNGTPADLEGQNQATLSVEGTASSFTVIVEGSVDGTNWHALEVVKRGSLDITQNITAKGIYVVDLGGLSKLRARISAVAGGDVTVLAR